MDIYWISEIRFFDYGSIFLYSLATAIFSPLPSEAPMFVFPELTRPEVLIWCAAGKSTGAYVVFLSGKGLKHTKFFYLVSKIRIILLKRVVNLVLLRKLRIVIVRAVRFLLNRYGIWAFLGFMSIPLMPMRSAIYASAVTNMKHLNLILAVAVGTIIRNSLVFYGFLGVSYSVS
ncbi:MAG TPA: hypothetical protein PLL77_13640 [Pyrinomonadaceae bacterium]|nr:hypothetical protein [Pyrinomonadaceae bacterium]